jgi:hygromycin-B 7''-O-kinase
VARLTEIERIFERHGLGAVRSVEPLRGGQLNVALRVNGTLVLRCRGAGFSTGSLRREAAVLERIHAKVPAAALIAVGSDEVLGDYLVQSWMPGQSLLRAWLVNPDAATREWWLRQWIEAMRAIHEQRFPLPGELRDGELREYSSWRSYVESRIRKRLDVLMRTPGADRNLVIAADRYLRRNAGVLEDGPFCLIHRDLHFGNVLVEGPRLSAILDFELAEVGPPDYELDTIYRFLQEPDQFAGPELAAHVTPVRFASVWVRLRRAYPTLFVPHLRERLQLYALDRSLSCLVRAYSGRWGGGDAVDAALARITEILQGRYGPA